MTGRSNAVVIATLVVAGFAIGLLVMIRRGAAPPTPPPAVRDAASVPTVVVVDAPPPASDAAIAGPVARAERESLMTRLRESGRADEVWAQQAGALFEAIGRAPAQVDVVGCFIAGCGATFTLPSEADYRHRIDELETLEAYRAWTGGKQFTSPEIVAGGKVVFGLVLYRPD